jgi:hypothetical protein
MTRSSINNELMKKIFLVTLVSGLLFTIACKSKSDDKGKSGSNTTIRAENKDQQIDTNEVPVTESRPEASEPAGDLMQEMAVGMCECMAMVENKLSADTRQMIMDAANAANPKQAMQAAVMALSDEKKIQMEQELMGMQELDDRTTGVGACIKKLEDKYKDLQTMETDQQAVNRVAKAMESVNCPFGMAMMKIAAIASTDKGMGN